MYPELTTPPRPLTADTPRGRTLFAEIGVIVCVALLGMLSFVQIINWDEFYFLSLMHDFVDGRLDRPLQTFHVRLVGWITLLPGQEMMQVTVGRLVMLGCLLVTTACIHRIARIMAGREAALFAAFSFLSSGFVIGHGASFRADPMAASLLMMGLALVMTTPMRGVEMLGLAVTGALALLITVKSGLYLPAFLGALLWRAGDAGVVRRSLVAALGALGLAALGYLYHKTGITVAEGNTASENLRDALMTTLLSQSLLPRADTVALWLLLSLGPVTMVATAFAAAENTRTRIAMLLLLTPVASVLIYRNAFPYFLPFIVPPMMILAGIGLRSLSKSGFRLVLCLMMASVLAQGVQALSQRSEAQKIVLVELHRLFPEPVPYFGRNGMLARFPRQGMFMSSWGLQRYQEAGDPVFAQMIAQDAPPLLLANSPAFVEALQDRPIAEFCCSLLPEDAEALRRSYVQYWGPIWLLGHKVLVSETETPVTLTRSGVYHMMAAQQVWIDQRLVSPNQPVFLEAGQHKISAKDGLEVKLILHSGQALTPPPLPEAPLYLGFWSLSSLLADFTSARKVASQNISF